MRATTVAITTAIALAATSVGGAAAPALAAAPDSWTGAGATPDWSQATNWSGAQGLQANQTYPSLLFGDLPACDSGSAGAATCYASTDDVPVTLNELTLDDNLPYAISGSGSGQITLLGSDPGGGAGASTGLSAAPGGESPSGVTPVISVPVVIPTASDQTWDVAGDSAGHRQALVVDSIASGSPLAVNLGDGATLESRSITGAQPLTVSGGAAENTDNLSGELVFSGASESAMDPGGSISLSDGASLDVDTSGTVNGGGIDFADAGGGQLTIGAHQAPDTVLDTDAGVSFHGGIDFLQLFLDSSCPSSGCTAGTDNSALTSSATVDLAGATLQLGQGSDSAGFCDDLEVGQTYTLISAAAITGAPFANYPAGTPEPIEELCGLGPEGTPTYVQLNYTSTAVTATVTAVGNAGDIPQNTGAAPAITNKSRKVSSIFAGDTLSVSTGGWNVGGSSNSQTKLSYGYAWMRCTPAGACTQIGGQSGSSYTTSASDTGDTIYAEVTATNTLGSKQVASARVGPVLAVIAPSNTSAPKISGATTLGSKLTVTSRGGWSGQPNPGYKYQWLLCSQANVSSCTPTGGLGTARTLTLTAADLGRYVAVQVAASNRGGTTLATSNLIGRVVPTPATVLAALVKLRHPTGRATVRRLIAHRSYRTGFAAPSGGRLRITWRTTVTVGRGRHRRHRTVTVATGRATYAKLGAGHVTVRLTRKGRALLRRKPHGVRVTATDAFTPSGGSATTYRTQFTL